MQSIVASLFQLHAGFKCETAQPRSRKPDLALWTLPELLTTYAECDSVTKSRCIKKAIWNLVATTVSKDSI